MGSDRRPRCSSDVLQRFFPRVPDGWGLSAKAGNKWRIKSTVGATMNRLPDARVLWLRLRLRFSTSVSTDVWSVANDYEILPEFAEPVPNVSAIVGRTVKLPCVVNNLGQYRVAWLRVESKTILTIHKSVITQNYRVHLSPSDRTWLLVIDNVQESDRGGYMCQVNTVPMRSQVGYLDVLGTPDQEARSGGYVSGVTRAQKLDPTVVLQLGVANSIRNPRSRAHTFFLAAFPDDRFQIFRHRLGRHSYRLLSLQTRPSYCEALGRVLNLLQGKRSDEKGPTGEPRRPCVDEPLAAFFWLLRVSRIVLLLRLTERRLFSSYGVFDCPPDIVGSESSSDVLVREGSNVTLSCRAKGYPAPRITWRREDGTPIAVGNWQEQLGSAADNVSYEGEELSITKVSRLHMGPYLCIASNGVPSPVSRRILLQVHFPPMIWIPNQLIGAPLGGEVVMVCNTEAYPISINYWTLESGDLIAESAKYSLNRTENVYKVHMRLHISRIAPEDFGAYRCFAKNSLGSTEGSIRLFSVAFNASKRHLHLRLDREVVGVTDSAAACDVIVTSGGASVVGPLAVFRTGHVDERCSAHVMCFHTKELRASLAPAPLWASCLLRGHPKHLRIADAGVKLWLEAVVYLFSFETPNMGRRPGV
ncbi:hypothetical protein MTO96_004247 [Rhipicephalus appendiculatus]